jgi:hypothetical protein
MDLQNLKLEYKGERDGDKVLGKLVLDENEDLATYYAARSEARDAKIRWTRKEWLWNDHSDRSITSRVLGSGEDAYWREMHT